MVKLSLSLMQNSKSNASTKDIMRVVFVCVHHVHTSITTRYQSQAQSSYHSSVSKRHPCTMASTAIVASDGVNAEPLSFRIGPVRHAYNYNKVAEGVWRCERGSDEARDTHRLVLCRSPTGQWTAYDVCLSKLDQLDGTRDWMDSAIPVFDTEENPMEAGWHTWRTNWNRHRSEPDWRATGLSCETTHIDVAWD